MSLGISGVKLLNALGQSLFYMGICGVKMLFLHFLLHQLDAMGNGVKLCVSRNALAAFAVIGALGHTGTFQFFHFTLLSR
jgi:hypothetical protein